VDETGQDTLGQLFIVSVVIAATDRDGLVAELENIERFSRKGKVKWIHTRHQSRLAYMQAVLSASVFRETLYKILHGIDGALDGQSNPDSRR
jgi:hypothetical protein